MYALNRESAVEGYISRISRQKSQAFLPEGTKYANLAIIWHPQPSPEFGAHSHCRSLAPIAIAEACPPAIAEAWPQPSPKKSSKQKGPEGPFVIVLVDVSNEKRLALSALR